MYIGMIYRYKSQLCITAILAGFVLHKFLPGGYKNICESHVPCVVSYIFTRFHLHVMISMTHLMSCISGMCKMTTQVGYDVSKSQVAMV